METHFPSKTAASASTLIAPGAARFSQPAAERGETAGQPFNVGVGSSAPTGEPSNLTAAAGTPNRCNLLGPPTTNSPDGAGGPLNHWDREIAHWKAMDRPDLADGLQMARARFAIAFERLEPVFVPTDGQRLLYALRACPTGLRVRDAA